MSSVEFWRIFSEKIILEAWERSLVDTICAARIKGRKRGREGAEKRGESLVANKSNF